MNHALLVQLGFIALTIAGFIAVVVIGWKLLISNNGDKLH